MGEIVIGYDGSECAKVALDKAIELSKGLGDKMTIVFGYDPPGTFGGEIAEHQEAIKEFGNKVTAEGLERVKAAGIEAEIELVPRHSAEALTEVADQRGADLIVVGSYSEPPLKGAILGSTPQKLLHLADVPVVVVPAG